MNILDDSFSMPIELYGEIDCLISFVIPEKNYIVSELVSGQYILWKHY